MPMLLEPPRQRTLFEGLKPPPDHVVARMRAQRKAFQLIRGKWYGLPLEVAIDRLLGIRRRGRRRYSHKYVRLISGKNLFQARAWHPTVGSVHLGCYRSESDAWAAVQGWIRAGCDPCRGLPEGVLPKWVQREGDGFRVIVRGTIPEIPGWFVTAEDAHRAALAALQARRSGGVRHRFHPVQLFPVQAAHPQPGEFVAG